MLAEAMRAAFTETTAGAHVPDHEDLVSVARNRHQILVIRHVGARRSLSEGSSHSFCEHKRLSLLASITRLSIVTKWSSNHILLHVAVEPPHTPLIYRLCQQQ